jgi:catechol 2,3-dioxygenase-like lactoylglutathione lyase family enzyme
MKIKLTSVFVEDQEKALQFYTKILGFVKKNDFLMENARWLTVVSPEEPDTVELVLEPSDNPVVRPFKKALVDQGIPFTAFYVDSVHQEYERMKRLGVHFTMEPVSNGPITLAIFDDTCGNLIQIFHVDEVG